MKIIVDENIPLAQEYFSKFGDVVALPGRQLNSAQVKDADALIVRSVTQVNETLLAGSKVGFVGSCTIGMDHLDLAYMDSCGIEYHNAPGCNANSVVEYVFSALSALEYDWREKRFGIIGMGNVGSALYRRLSAMGLDCIAYDPLIPQDRYPILSSLDEILSCDVVSMHAPLTHDGEFPSHHMVGEQELDQLKLDAILLNCGRGDCIDNAALLALLERRPARVVLDVWENEPNVDLDLVPKIQLASPHIAGYSYDGKVMGTAMIAAAFTRYINSDSGHDINSNTVSMAELDVRPLLLNPELDNTQDIIRRAILAVYNVQADDKNFRVAANNLSSEFALQFDQLRKQYPKRLEFKHYSLDVEQFKNLSPNEKKLLDRDLITLGYARSMRRV